MWTPENRSHYERKGLRYPTDLTDAEWALVEPHIRPAKRGGRPRTTNMREVANAILYLLGTGCQWRALPKDFPPRTTWYLPHPGRSQANGPSCGSTSPTSKSGRPAASSRSRR